MHSIKVYPIVNRMIVTKQENINGDDYQIVISIDKHDKSSINVYVNEMTNTSVGSYVYSINDKKSGQIYSSVLQDHSSNIVTEQARNLGYLVVKKYCRPSYTNINGQISDYPQVLKVVFNLLDESI